MRFFPGADVTLAGTVVQFTVMQDIVSKGQLKSFLIAICVITGLMVLVFGSFKIGLIAMIPNITPALAVGGLMGWIGVPLDMMTITIMPMLLGLAVDDTIHFINHAKLAFENKRDYAHAISHTFSAIGIPLLFTSLILTANFSVYLSSPANVLVFMGLFTGTGIMTALLNRLSCHPGPAQGTQGLWSGNNCRTYGTDPTPFNQRGHPMKKKRIVPGCRTHCPAAYHRPGFWPHPFYESDRQRRRHRVRGRHVFHGCHGSKPGFVSDG